MDPNLQNSQENPHFKILSDSSSQLGFRRPILIGKRSLAEFQEQQLHHQQFQHGNYLRNVKSRPYQQNSPISPLSPMEISAASISSSDLSSISNNSSALSVGAPRYGIPVIQQLRQQQNFYLGSPCFRECSTKTKVDLPRGQKTDRVDVSLQPEELELMDNVLPAKYEEAREEEKMRSQLEDFSDMVAENAKKRKRKMQEKDSKSKKKDFKF